MTKMIYDLRRLCTEFVFYTPRKTAKTQLAAFVGFLYFMDFDENNEVYCCALSQDQSKILYNRIFGLVHQMDPREQRIRFTASQLNWKHGQFRSATVTALSAGGKAKDGLFAGLCLADEFGSAEYVNGSSDMGKLVSVVESSMGPRRNPMTFISTTAGIIQQGPFLDKLSSIRIMLEKELDPEAEHTISEDRQMCLILEPDMWEQSDEELLLTDPKIRQKVNPMLRVIVQNSFYDDEIAKARQNPEKMNEVITKLLNVYKCARVTQWMTGDKIRPIQIPKFITDCKFANGWHVFVGLDFGGRDDLFAISYLAVNFRPEAAYEERYFADMTAWITESALNSSPNRELYLIWIKQGWLNVCPGEVFNSDLAINQLMSLNQQGINMFTFGYDPAQSPQPINTIKAWLQTLGIDAQTIKHMVLPVSQGGMTMTPLISQLESMILDARPWIRFSQNPMWPWEFGNCGLYAGKDGTSTLMMLKKMVVSQKIDNVHALLDALYGFCFTEGQMQ